MVHRHGWAGCGGENEGEENWHLARVRVERNAWAPRETAKGDREADGILMGKHNGGTGLTSGTSRAMDR